MTLWCPACGVMAMEPHLPAAPLVGLIERQLGPVCDRRANGGWAVKGERRADSSNESIFDLLNRNDRRNYYRGAQRGCYTITQADRLAVAFGHHPAEIWTDWADACLQDILA